jgi:hypothetical protein
VRLPLVDGREIPEPLQHRLAHRHHGGGRQWQVGGDQLLGGVGVGGELATAFCQIFADMHGGRATLLHHGRTGGDDCDDFLEVVALEGRVLPTVAVRRPPA